MIDTLVRLIHSQLIIQYKKPDVIPISKNNDDSLLNHRPHYYNHIIALYNYIIIG